MIDLFFINMVNIDFLFALYCVEYCVLYCKLKRSVNTLDTKIVQQQA
jgi:hypothetical protein